MPVVVSIWLSSVSSVPLAIFFCAVRSSASTGELSPCAGSAACTALELILGDGENDRDRLELRDHHEGHRPGRLHDVAGIDQAQARRARQSGA